jgi:hypothetical protein
LLPVVAKAVLPAAKKALPRMAKAVSRVTPQLTKGVAKIARGLHRNPQTRHLLRAVPSVARRTVGSIARQAAKGHPVTPRVAVKTLARQTKRVLGTPARRAHALRRHQTLERGFHRRWGRGVARPHAATGRAVGASHPAGQPAVHPAAQGVAKGAAPRAATGAPGVTYGKTVGGQCVCPTCSTVKYCRCCGQVLR